MSRYDDMSTALGPDEARTARAKVSGYSSPEPNTGCWLWSGAMRKNGYGSISYRNKTIPAHRFSYAAFVAPIPVGLHVCHRCDNPSCVNPDHLFVGTRSDNMIDCSKKGRHRYSGRDRCKHGHPLSVQGGRRVCLECHRAYGRAAWRARNPVPEPKTACKHGHELVPGNVRTTTRGHRRCRTCDRIHLKRQREKKRGLAAFAHQTDEAERAAVAATPTEEV